MLARTFLADSELLRPGRRPAHSRVTTASAGTCAGAASCRAAARAWPQRHGLRRCVRVVAAPRVRRLAGIASRRVDRARRRSSASAAPAHATDVHHDHRAPTSRSCARPRPPGPTTTIAAPAPVPPPAPAPAPSLPAPVPAGPSPTARTHVVVAGDNLWRIAANELARTTGVADRRIARSFPYWRAVIDANRATLRSGDPSLIFPGEIVTLPAR